MLALAEIKLASIWPGHIHAVVMLGYSGMMENAKVPIEALFLHF